MVVIFAGAVETVQRPAGWTAGPTGVALPPPVNSTMRVGVGGLAAEATDGAAKASAVLASASASAVRTRRMRPPPGARPGAPLHLVQVACRFAPSEY